MDKLLEIVQLVKNVNVSKTELITHTKSNTTNIQEFYNLLVDGKFSSDQEASKFFFKKEPNHSQYKNLKRYLKQKMYNMVFFIEPNKDHGDFSKAYIYCCKKLFIAKILISLGARKSGIELCHKVHNKALSFELSEFMVESSRFLRLHYGSRVGDQRKFEFYNKHYKTYAEILMAERKAEEFYIRLTMPFVKSIIIDDGIIEKAGSFYADLKPALIKHSSPILHFYGNYIKILRPLFKNDYLQMIQDCKNAITFFEAKPYNYDIPLRVFYHNLLVGYTQLKLYEEGKNAIAKASKLVLSGTYSWYVNKELHLILAFHSKKYEAINTIIDSALTHKKFRLLDEKVKERWSIYSAYAYFLTIVGKLDSTSKVRGFRLGKFLNTMPIYSQDKRGLNIPILIIQIAIMITRKEYGKTIDRFDAIKKYASRHIKKKYNYRSYCFINMLLLLPKSSFNKTAVIRKSEVYYDQLQNTPLEIANQPHEVEIIPYEEFWEYILDSLDNKFH